MSKACLALRAEPQGVLRCRHGAADPGRQEQHRGCAWHLCRSRTTGMVSAARAHTLCGSKSVTGATAGPATEQDIATQTCRPRVLTPADGKGSWVGHTKPSSAYLLWPALRAARRAGLASYTPTPFPDMHTHRQTASKITQRLSARSRQCSEQTLLEMLATYTMPSACPMCRATAAAPKPRGGCSTSVQSSKNAPASAPNVFHHVIILAICRCNNYKCLSSQGTSSIKSFAIHAFIP